MWNQDHYAGLDNFKIQVVQSHNQFRVSHGCPRLNLADDLNNNAQDWANTLADRGYLQYSETPGIGENVVIVDRNGRDVTGSDVTKQWYEERSKYDYKNPRWRRGVNNFTQLIWKSTSEIGVGVSKLRDSDKYVVVTQYRPPGNNNMPGEFKKNVLPPHETSQQHVCN
ncbi:Golgi-associated plant pathogenesis-related protein 1-like [Liolophura sinensis]|uniref:Golgi-associated plant pathogenesis-related protein 1-like n=1 Tax=Liolophura sinensis TaxID=3198878 RepID=UPI0031588C0F